MADKSDDPTFHPDLDNFSEFISENDLMNILSLQNRDDLSRLQEQYPLLREKGFTAFHLIEVSLDNNFPVGLRDNVFNNYVLFSKQGAVEALVRYKQKYGIPIVQTRESGLDVGAFLSDNMPANKVYYTLEEALEKLYPILDLVKFERGSHGVDWLDFKVSGRKEMLRIPKNVCDCLWVEAGRTTGENIVGAANTIDMFKPLVQAYQQRKQTVSESK